MKLSLRWLKELVPDCAPVTALDGQGAAQALTAVGLEVEGVEARGQGVQGVIVAEVLAVRPASLGGQAPPGADPGRPAGEEEVVCGAANVPGPGGRVVWAPPGARLPGDRVLEARGPCAA